MSGTYLTFDLEKLREMGGSPILNGQFTASMKHLKALEEKYGEFSTRTPIHPDEMDDVDSFSEGCLTFGPLEDIVSHRCDYMDLEDATKSGAVYVLIKDLVVTNSVALDMVIESIKNTADMYGQEMPPLYLSSGSKLN